MNIKHLSYDQILKDTLSESTVYQEMIKWKDNSKEIKHQLSYLATKAVKGRATNSQQGTFCYAGWAMPTGHAQNFYLLLDFDFFTVM